ncbi:MAG TPA: hypothetical protein VF789_26685 [Thermoanaerobaculia bacterium]
MQNGSDRGESSDQKSGGTQLLPPRLLAALKWLLASIGISGLFIATGFLIDTGYQSRLGFDAGTSGEIRHLSVEAGRFFVDLLLISFKAVADHSVLLGIVVVLATLAAIRPGRRLASRLRGKLSSAVPRPLLPWLLPALLLLEMGVLDLPVMSLQGMLIHGLQSPAEGRRSIVLSTLAEQAWLDEVCSRVSRSHRPALKRVSIQCPHSQSRHLQRQKDRFALNLFLTVVLTGWAFGLSQRQRHGPAARRAMSAALLLACLDLVLLPYSYGKSIRSTYVGEVVLRREPQETSVHGLLLQRSPDAYVVFEKSELQIWAVPQDEVGVMRIENELDVVQFFIEKKLEVAGQSDTDSAFPP